VTDRAKIADIRAELQTFISALHRKYELEGFMSGWLLVVSSSTIDDDGDPTDTQVMYTAPDQSPTFTVGLAVEAFEWVKRAE
jgi:hypothetical protein